MRFWLPTGLVCVLAGGCAPEDVGPFGPLYTEDELAQLAASSPTAQADDDDDFVWGDVAEPVDATDVVYQGAWADYFETLDLVSPGGRTPVAARFADPAAAEPYADVFDLWEWYADGSGTGIAFLPASFFTEVEDEPFDPYALPWISVPEGDRTDLWGGDGDDHCRWTDTWFMVVDDLTGHAVAIAAVDPNPDVVPLNPDISAHVLSPELLGTIAVDGETLVREEPWEVPTP